MGKSSFFSAAASILIRLPIGFLAPFIGLVVFWTIWLFDHLREPAKAILKSISYNPTMEDILGASVILIIYLTGVFVAYNLSVVFNLLSLRYLSKPLSNDAQPHRPPQKEIPSELFKDIHKIGIVLAGGGAKGAFQAGAMKAIYRFLAEHDALDKVKVISGTSIGSWNALFWLGDLLKSPRGWDEWSIHERWWRAIKLKLLVAPSWYLPAVRNSFLDTAPWQANFDDLFGQEAIKNHLAQSGIHFYLTRANVRTGRLECTTNNPNPTRIPKVRYKVLNSIFSIGSFRSHVRSTDAGAEILDPAKGADEFLQGVKFGVFASMDLPPLFPYMQSDDNFYEDGGVIDNLPIMFAAMESCDLIFVLPLNSDFNAIPDQRSLLNRFLRVMDVRQGALERSGLKTLYLYNEIAALRDYISAIKEKIEIPAIEMSETLKFALARSHKQTRIFAICPLRAFVESTIDTQQLWKGQQAGLAFRVMYEATMETLTSNFDPSHERIRVALINAGGDTNWDEDF